MQTKTYRTCDKSTWGPGPWVNEPDKIQWQDKTTGLPCLIVRNTHGTGSLCGYVGVPPGHKLHGIAYSSKGAIPCTAECDDDSYHQCSPQYVLNVHGGITFSDFCHPRSDEAEGICHVPDPGEPDYVFWFGFDCSHAWDFCPKMESTLRSLKDPVLDKLAADKKTFPRQYQDVYRTIRYVKGEVRRLAKQLAAM